MRARSRLTYAGVAFSLFLAVLVAVFARPSAGQESAGDLVPDQQVLTPEKSLVIAADGTPEYLSPPTEAPRPFSHMLIRREAAVPPGAALTLFVRASIDGTDWSRWEEIIPNDDLYDEADGPDVLWSQVVDVGAVARFWQVRGMLTAAPDGSLPVIRRIEVNTLDATRGPANPAPDMPLAPAEKAAGKPAVVSRTAWGSPDGQGSRRAPAYRRVTHLVVHHTAEANPLYPGQVNWAARVRAIWSYHAITRGWGDIGYNYLIDPFGTIYEGRAGGDDAVAFHDTANYGSMGVAMLGTFQSVAPPEATLDSLVRLLAWKASQRGIDPLGSSVYYGCTISSYCKPFNAGGVVPNIAGHRQVTPGHTTCPGDATMARMAEIRNRVKQLVDGGVPDERPDNGDLEIDELERSFSRSPANWYSAACGVGGHTYYTFGTDNPAQSTNSATWRPNIPERARYRVFVHVPTGCGVGQPTANAVYRVHSADGDAQRAVNQGSASGWVDIGAYTFDAGTSGAVELYDITGEPLSAGRVLFFDAVKWVREDSEASVALVDVQYDKLTLAAGELLKVSFTLENTGRSTLYGQEPQVEFGPPENGYVYDQTECFAGDPSGLVPVFAKETQRIRLTLGTVGWDSANAGRCNGATSDYPWRWGLNAPLEPGQRQTVIGYVRMSQPGTYTLRAGVVQEYVKYLAENVKPTTITVTPERVAPDAAAYDAQLRPLAHVYQLGAGPESQLARTGPTPTLPIGAYVGSFPWTGAFIDWGEGGPLGQTDRFVVMQTRTFLAPVSGEYVFRTVSDDGSWLLVDGQPVVANGGLHGVDEAVGAVRLSAGVHVLTFVAFDYVSSASAGYDVQLPGSLGFVPVIDGLGSGAMRGGAGFAEPPDLAIAADDPGGSGVARIRWRWAGGEWQDSPGPLLRTGRLQHGTYRLEYQAVDAAGNYGPVRELVFTVDTTFPLNRQYMPLMFR
ncbi:MAG: N-acetylmuramoyl-L-alanine amidase [Chloroflexota bacterium]